MLMSRAGRRDAVMWPLLKMSHVHSNWCGQGKWCARPPHKPLPCFPQLAFPPPLPVFPELPSPSCCCAQT